MLERQNDTQDAAALSPAEAERQLLAAAERHREAVTSLQEGGRPPSGERVAAKVAGRAVHLVSFALRRASDAGIPFERLVELSAWDPDLVRGGLERLPAPPVVARLAPAGIDPAAVVHVAAGFEVLSRLQELLDAVRADVDPDLVATPPSPGDADDRYTSLQTAWRAWRQGLEMPAPGR